MSCASPFAVAAALEPEIFGRRSLAVGDINFNASVSRKHGDVARAGSTIILVSHQSTRSPPLSGVVWPMRQQKSERKNRSTRGVIGAYERESPPDSTGRKGSDGGKATSSVVDLVTKANRSQMFADDGELRLQFCSRK